MVLPTVTACGNTVSKLIVVGLNPGAEITTRSLLIASLEVNAMVCAPEGCDVETNYEIALLILLDGDAVRNKTMCG